VWRRLVLVIFALLSCALLGGCARTVPPKPASAALYRDLQRLVTLSETAGWQIDRVEVDGVLPGALLSVCAVEPEQRLMLGRWLDERIRDSGGPVEEAWRRRGRRLDAVDALLELHRIRLVLARAIAVAPDDCPFWIEPEPGFRGRQISDDRWQLSFGGGGKGIVSMRDGEADLRFGGAGRLMIGRVIGSRWGVYGGVEAGGTAAFPKDEHGTRGNLELGVDAVALGAARYHFVNTYVEGELGHLFRVSETDRAVDPGIHLGFAIGGRASRKRYFFPGAAFAGSYERTFQTVPIHLVKLGFRVAIDADL